MSAIFVLDNSETGYEGQHQRFCGLGLLEESVQFVVEILVVRLGDFVRRAREFHLTDVDRLVSAVDDKVELCAFACLVVFSYPAASSALYARDSQGLLDLGDVVQANL